MEKVIKIDDNTEIKLSNNIGWLYAYQDQFGHDIVPDLMPILGAVFELIEGMNESDISVRSAKSLINGVVGGGTATNALIELSGLRSTDMVNIIWALAKTADESIDPPYQWVRQFDVFPVDEIFPQAFTLVAQGVMSSKNWIRLQNAVADLRAPKAKTRKKKQASTTSSSQE